MYNNLSIGKVQVQTPTNGDEELPGHFSGENEQNVPWFQIYPKHTLNTCS